MLTGYGALVLSTPRGGNGTPRGRGKGVSVQLAGLSFLRGLRASSSKLGRIPRIFQEFAMRQKGRSCE